MKTSIDQMRIDLAEKVKQLDTKLFHAIGKVHSVEAEELVKLACELHQLAHEIESSFSKSTEPLECCPLMASRIAAQNADLEQIIVDWPTI